MTHNPMKRNVQFIANSYFLLLIITSNIVMTTDIVTHYQADFEQFPIKMDHIEVESTYKKPNPPYSGVTRIGKRCANNHGVIYE